MARRVRRRTVKGRPNYCWISIAGEEAFPITGVNGYSAELLIPTDWQTTTATNTECKLCHIVYTHAVFGTAVASTFSWCGLYSINKMSDALGPNLVVPPTGTFVGFSSFFEQYDECLHWGQFTAMPYDALALASDLWVGGGSLAAMPENMVNLNVRRNLKGDDSLRVCWSHPTVNTDRWSVRWFSRCLVRLGLK